MAGDVLDTVGHPNQDRYPHQQAHVIIIEEFVYLVAFVEADEEVFLKTIISRREVAKNHLGKRKCASCRAKS